MMAAAFAALGLPHTLRARGHPAAEVRATVDALRARPIVRRRQRDDAAQGGGGRSSWTSARPTPTLAGAVNTVVRRGHAAASGTTRTCRRSSTAIRRLAPERRRARRACWARGGAARGVELALAECGARAVQTAARVRWQLGADGGALADGGPRRSTPRRSAPRSDESPVPADLLRPDLAVLDLVYRPSPTRLVRDARAAGRAARSWRGRAARPGRAEPGAVARRAGAARSHGDAHCARAAATAPTWVTRWSRPCLSCRSLARAGRPLGQRQDHGRRLRRRAPRPALRRPRRARRASGPGRTPARMDRTDGEARFREVESRGAGRRAADVKPGVSSPPAAAR